MKVMAVKGLQNVVLLVNAAVFEGLVKAGILDAVDRGDTTKENVVAVVKETTGANVVAVLPCSFAKKEKRKRSQAEKVGKWRYFNRKVDRLRSDVKELKHGMKMVLLSLAPFLEIDEDRLTRIVCVDEVDVALLDHFRAKGDVGTTPSEAIVSDELRGYGLKPYHITRRVQRMNRRLKETLDRDLAVSVNRRWKLSMFAQKTLEGDIKEGEENEVKIC